ncbi:MULTISPECIES: DUF2922 domain-containing protein [Bhargavaea]|uniref:DUF2922 domain-containing protein n=1 Tax=Bhargavaea changchunensis TaxID=2134037 RepID=A0ABW2NHT4_9BACL|nr:DUF2922 domain-containing protein [Bhargavaea sp. CC-171006]
MDQTLELIFRTAGGKRMTFSVDEPKEGLTEPEVRQAMQEVIDSGVFGTDGHPLESAEAARIVSRGVTDIITA